MTEGVRDKGIGEGVGRESEGGKREWRRKGGEGRKVEMGSEGGKRDKHLYVCMFHCVVGNSLKIATIMTSPNLPTCVGDAH